MRLHESSPYSKCSWVCVSVVDVVSRHGQFLLFSVMMIRWFWIGDDMDFFSFRSFSLSRLSGSMTIEWWIFFENVFFLLIQIPDYLCLAHSFHIVHFHKALSAIRISLSVCYTFLPKIFCFFFGSEIIFHSKVNDNRFYFQSNDLAYSVCISYVYIFSLFILILVF